MTPKLLLACFTAVLLATSGTAAAENTHAGLPQVHEYQRTLRSYLASLSEQDFVVDVKPFNPPAADASLDALCRLWVLSQHIPPIGGVAAPPAGFTLNTIEGSDAVMRPPADPLAVAWLAGWDDAMNPYRAAAAVKRRAMAVAIVDLIMNDGLHERTAGYNWVDYGLLTGNREGRTAHSDCLGGTLIWLGYAYLMCGDVMPPDARKAYEAGLIKLVHRLNDWGPTALMTDMDLFASVSLGYIAQAVDDPEVKKIADSYTRRLYTDPRFFSRAGYWVDIQGYDASYNGISFYFADWAALATGRKEIIDAVERAYRLKASLALPEPNGTLMGPSHFSPRTSFDSAHDQWGWPHKHTAGSLITPEAAYLVDVPPDDKLRGVATALVTSLDKSVADGDAAKPAKWTQLHWTNAFNFGFAHYPAGYHERRRQLEQESPAMLKPPFAHGETFIKRFGDDFIVARFADYGVVLHSGPVGVAEDNWPTPAKWMPRDKPFGFSGGALSAFWTPTGGSILLGRRGGAQGESPDRYEEWRLWPIHAVTGETAAGRVFTSARILRPKVDIETSDNRAAVEAEGVIPRTYAGQGDALTGDIRYRRRFTADAKGVRVETRIESDGKDALAELCETIPVFIDSNPPKEGMGPVEIEFRIGDSDGSWKPAGVEYQDNVAAVRVKRYAHTILIAFDKPRRVKLSPRNWTDGYQSRATCRTILIDLLNNAALFREASVEYTISPVRP